MRLFLISMRHLIASVALCLILKKVDTFKNTKLSTLWI